MNNLPIGVQELIYNCLNDEGKTKLIKVSLVSQCNFINVDFLIETLNKSNDRHPGYYYIDHSYIDVNDLPCSKCRIVFGNVELFHCNKCEQNLCCSCSDNTDCNRCCKTFCDSCCEYNKCDNCNCKIIKCCNNELLCEKCSYYEKCFFCNKYSSLYDNRCDNCYDGFCDNCSKKYNCVICENIIDEIYCPDCDCDDNTNKCNDCNEIVCSNCQSFEDCYKCSDEIKHCSQKYNCSDCSKRLCESCYKENKLCDICE